MKSKMPIIVGIVVIILVIGGFLLFHKSYKSNSRSGSTSKASTVASNPVFITKSDPSLGQYLAEPNSTPLYTYGSDTSGVSNCSGSCLANWPAYQDTGSTSNLPSGVSIIKRTDNGQTQYTYNGMPLYTFVSDSDGNVTGNGVEGFTVAKPSSASSTPTTTSPATSTPGQSTNSNSSYSYPY